jgi:hypothetical protein
MAISFRHEVAIADYRSSMMSRRAAMEFSRMDIITFLASTMSRTRSSSRAHDIIRVRTEVVIPRSRSSPHLVGLQQVRIDEDARLLLKPKGGHAAIGLRNPLRY